MIELPRDLPILERDAVRLVVRDSEDRILLFHTHEITLPELGVWWELPGGGIDEGETYLDAAVRELREETGIRVSAAQVGRPTWRRTASFRHRELRHLQHEVVVEVRLDAPGAAVDEGERLDYEKEDYFGFRWWSIGEIVGQPGGLLSRTPAGAPAAVPGRRRDRRAVRALLLTRPEEIPAVAGHVEEHGDLPVRLLARLARRTRRPPPASGRSCARKSSTRRNRPTRPANWSPTARAWRSPSARASSSAVAAPGGRTTTQRLGRPSLVSAGESSTSSKPSASTKKPMASS